MGVNDEKKIIKNDRLIIVFGLLAVIGNSVQIYSDYVRDISLSGYVERLYQYFCNYNHVCLGALLFLLMKKAFDKLRVERHQKIVNFLKFTDKYSYETYLVHQFLILGPFSLMALTPFQPINIATIVGGIIFLAGLLKKTEERMMNVIGQL